MSTNTYDESLSSSLATPIPESHKNQSAHNVGVTAGIIGIVFIIGIIYLVFRLYLAKLYNRRQRHLGSVAPLTTKQQKQGLDPEAISMLPKFVYQPQKSCGHANGSNGSALECAICISELVEGEIVRVLPICKHFFHVECIDTWLGTHSSCPMCRAHPEQEKMKLYGTSSEGGEPGLGPCLESPFSKSPRGRVSATLGLPFVLTPRGASACLRSPFMLTPRGTHSQEMRIDATSDLDEIRIDEQ